MSIAESKLWNALRDRRMEGVKFRRQHPIGRHIADLACVELKLVIEVDGESHDATSNEDAVRTKALEALGSQVMRVANEDVLFGFDGVLREIYDVCVRRATTPSPQPSPPSTGERE